MDKYIPKIGDVVLDNNIPNVVISMKSYEDTSSCSYDREYLLCEEEYIRENQGDIRLTELQKHGRWIAIRGSSFPDICKVDGIVPYNVNKIESYSIKKKVAKTITVYE